MSTGIRFTTLPDATPPSFKTPSSQPSLNPHMPSQPPTTITALFNPMLGHMSGAYAARVSRDLALCSRFDFNVYSYESEWSVGAEWWTRRGKSKVEAPVEGDSAASPPPLPASVSDLGDVRGVVKVKASTTAVSV